jgi:hypothetical protein
MKKLTLIFALILFSGNFLFAQTWDILDKSMAAYNQNDGASTNKAWGVVQGSSAASVVTQQNGYVNFTKTNAGSTARWAWLRPVVALADLTSGLTYSIEIKARVNAIDKTQFPDGTYFEANQISLRLANKATTPIYLRYGDSETGSISTTSGGANSYKINTSDWQIYRIVLRANLKYDVYIDGVEEPIFEAQLGGTNGDQNGVYLGSESQHRCNLDVEYVKVGTGDFFSNSQILSVLLSRDSHLAGTGTTVSITANTASIANGEELLFSFIDGEGNEKAPTVEAVVANNVAATNIVIPADLAVGVYYVKVSAKNQINGVDIDSKTIPYEIKDPLLVETWDILDRDFSIKAWDASPAWSSEKAASIPTSFVTQKDGYVNITKTQAPGSNAYGFLISPTVTVSANTAYTYQVKARTQFIDKEQFPDGISYEANQIGVLLNNKIMSINLIHGDENTGYIASPISDRTGAGLSSSSRYKLNTSEWHIYSMVFNADNTKCDVYVDDQLIFEDAPIFGKTGNNVKIGAESWQRCNMDIEYVKLGTGDLVTGDNPRITTMDLSSDSHVVDNVRTIRITVNTINILNGEKLTASFTDKNGSGLIDPIDILINTNKGTAYLTIPATIPLGKYLITVGVPNDKIGEQTVKSKSRQYFVVGVSPLNSKMLPQVKPVGFVKDIKDYIYTAPGASKAEFIFPSIVDTKKYTVDGKFKNGQAPIDRYYLYYSPHDNPGGMYLSTAPTLDGPWTEYAGTAGLTPGTVVDFNWAVAQNSIVNSGNEKHISGCQVVWNEVQDKYIMYFHGPNEATHYATSDDLINWTFGETVLFAYEFSPIGAEASYAKTFKHKIPGLDNEYVMLLMNQENQIRKIYWAHSKDGINWTPVPKPLISPDLNYKKIPGTDIKPNYDGGGTGAYGNNVSGPFLMEKDGRYFVFVHGCTDHLLVTEVGEAFDMEVHWGEYLYSTEAMFSISGGTPSATRIAAPDFIQDDNGKWYMFFEAGGRLGANIGYAKEEANTAVIPLQQDASVSIRPTVVKRGQFLTVEAKDAQEISIDLFDVAGKKVNALKLHGQINKIKMPYDPGVYFLKAQTKDNLTKKNKIIVIN